MRALPEPRATVLLVLVYPLMLGTLASPSQAQPTRLSKESKISLITILPGEPVYSFAGHSAFRVRDPAQNFDRLYNYGTFSFNDPLFIPKFTYGHLRYFLSVQPYGPMKRAYRQQGRPMIEQTLQLTRSQRTKLFRFLQQNARPENRYYQYDFFFDNCSTRIRDALKKTLGESVDLSGAPPLEKSFRQLLDPYVASRPLLDLGFDLALGLPADRTATAQEALFLPEHLMHGFEQATVSSDGKSQPLVTNTDTIQWISGYDAAAPSFDWPVSMAWLFLVFVGGWTSWQATTGRRPNATGDAILFAGVGFVGLLLCYLWFISTYAVTEYNLNLGWAWPTHLIAAALLIQRPNSRGLRLYLGITAIASAMLAAGWPFWPQDLHAAVLPLVLSLGVRAGLWALSTPQKIAFLRSASAAPFASPSSST